MKDLRLKIRTIRKGIAISEGFKSAIALSYQLQKSAILKNPQKVAVYLANDGELNTNFLIKTLKAKGHKVYLPILYGSKLKFSKINNQFVKNRFGILEPKIKNLIHPYQLNTILMSLVAFDKSCNRLGMGGGFYDRSFAFLTTREKFKYPKLYGIAYECQKLEKLAINPWDVPLDGVISPNNFYKSIKFVA